MSEHSCEYTNNPLRAKADWIHNLLQELEEGGVALPCGDYSNAYDAIETVRDTSAELLAALKYMVENAEAEGWSELMLSDAVAAINKAEGRGDK
jgi:hypothetical protein